MATAEQFVRSYYSKLNVDPISASPLFTENCCIRRFDHIDNDVIVRYEDLHAILSAMTATEFVLQSVDTSHLNANTPLLIALATGTFLPSIHSFARNFVESLELIGSNEGLHIHRSIFRSLDDANPYSFLEDYSEFSYFSEECVPEHVPAVNSDGGLDGASYSLGANLNVADTGVDHHMLAGATSLASSSCTGVLLSSTEEPAENGVEAPVGGAAIEEQLDAPEYVPTYAEMLRALPGFAPAADPTLDH